jgi:hypothetical protein
MYQAKSGRTPPPQVAAYMAQVRHTQLGAMAACVAATGRADGLLANLSASDRKTLFQMIAARQQHQNIL